MNSTVPTTNRSLSINVKWLELREGGTQAIFRRSNRRISRHVH